MANSNNIMSVEVCEHGVCEVRGEWGGRCRYCLRLLSKKNGQQGSGEATPSANINHPATRVTALLGGGHSKKEG